MKYGLETQLKGRGGEEKGEMGAEGRWDGRRGGKEREEDGKRGKIDCYNNAQLE